MAKIISRDDSDVYLYDRESNSTRLLTEHDGEVNFSATTFSPDGRSVYLLTDDGSEFQYLVRQDLSTGQRETRRRIAPPNGWDHRLSRTRSAVR